MNTETIDDCGPAFPCEVYLSPQDTYPTMIPGMTLRDWFAGQALTGLCASQWGGLQQVPTFVERSYEFADSMVAARKGAPK